VPVRLTHWAIALCVPALWYTAETGNLALHQTIGFVALALVLFRLYWGFAGSETARFSSFIKGPGAVLKYLGTLGAKTAPIIGHNAAGGWSVAALLLALAFQIGLGLVAQDVDGLVSGPLSHLVSYDVSDAAREWHEALFNVLLVLIALHLVAVAFYAAVRRDNLVGPMVTGRKRIASERTPRLGHPVHALLAVSGAGGLAWWISQGAPLP
jgi:cytochrome b